MKSKARLRVSYVLPQTGETSVGHRLGANSLAYDVHRSIVYSGGRDGMVCGWNASAASEGNRRDNAVPPLYSIQAHRNWINDCQLVSSGAVVTASSDASIKLWRPHAFDSQGSETIGTHGDYVKCVASPGDQEVWAASGSLDRHIAIWDLNGAGERQRFKTSEPGSEKGSVYALAARGALIISGGTENVVRLWDARSGQRVSEFIGHTDVVRGILFSENQDKIITGSSDKTIKIWSVTAGRCISSLAIHSDSVWSLHSEHPSLATFYSADRGGLVVKTESLNSSDHDRGLSFALCQEHDGINRVLAANGLVWTATPSSSVNCWQDVRGIMQSIPRAEAARVSGAAHSRTPSVMSSRQRELHVPFLNAKIPPTCLLRVSNIPGCTPSALKVRTRQQSHCPSTARKTSLVGRDLLSLPVTPALTTSHRSTAGRSGFIKHILLNNKRHVLTLDTSGTVLMWDILKCVQVRSYGKRHLSEVADEINTRDVIPNWCTIDTKVGTISCTLHENRCLDAEVYADELEQAKGYAFADDHRVNLGKWALTYLFKDFIEEEIARDEKFRVNLTAAKPTTHILQRTAALGTIDLSTALGMSATNIPRASDRPILSPALGIGAATPACSRSGLVEASNVVDASDSEGIGDLTGDVAAKQQQASKEDYFSQQSGEDADEASSNSSRKMPITPTDRSDNERSATSSEAGQQGQTNTIGPSLGKRFRSTFSPKKLGRPMKQPEIARSVTVAEDEQNTGAKQKTSEAGDSSFGDRISGIIQQISREYIRQKQAGHEVLESSLIPYSSEQAPTLNVAPGTMMIIQEESSDAAAVTDLVEAQVGELAAKIELIESIGPAWLGEILLRSHRLFADPAKLTFLLKPYRGLLPDIVEDTSDGRLTANSLIRARKALHYVARKLQSSEDLQSSSQLKPEEYLELYCQDQAVPLDMSLASIRAYLWRTGGDVILHYKSNGKRIFAMPQKERRGSDTDGLATRLPG